MSIDEIKRIQTNGGTYIAGNVYTGGGDFVAGDKYEIHIPQHNKDARERRNQLILLEKVRKFWIKGVLEKSLHNEVLIALGKALQPEMVDHPWAMIVELPDREPHSQNISDLFDEANRALLILGEPGSGKTTTLLQLACDLLTRAEKDPLQPIPVILNLSTWGQKKQAFNEWAVEELVSKYQIPQQMGLRWLLTGDLLLLLDGLDEVQIEHRVTCVNAINYFGKTHALSGIVTCSRVVEYREIGVQLGFSGAVLLKPLTTEQIDEFADQVGIDFLTAFETEQSLYEIANTPLMLNVLSLAYSDRVFETIQRRGKTVELLYKGVFDAYIKRMFSRQVRTKRELFVRKNTLKWLSWLARQMIDHNLTVFNIYSIQPSWLETTKQKLLYAIISRSFIGMILCSLIGFLICLFGGESSSSTFVHSIFFRLAIWTTNLFVMLCLSSAFGALIGSVFGIVSVKKASREHVQIVDAVGFSGEIVKTNIKNLFQRWLGQIRDPGALNDFPIAIYRLGIELVNSIPDGLTSIVPEIESQKYSIWRSIKNGLIVGAMGIMYGFIYALVIYCILFFRSIWEAKIDMESWVTGTLFLGVILGFTFFIKGIHRYGGFVIIQHTGLRLALLFSRKIPWKFRHFLDYACSSVFLRKIGDSYIFIHRTLMEHFATLCNDDIERLFIDT